MRTLKDAKERYDRTEIPQDLSGRVLQEVGRAGRRRRKLLFFRRARMTAAVGSGCCHCVRHGAEHQHGRLRRPWEIFR